jgi:hypothetical protein
MNRKAVSVAFFIAVVILSYLTPTLPVVGQTTVGSQIDQVFPSELAGVVGQAASVLGSIDTRNGKFEVYFGSILVANGTAQDNSVGVSFNLPETTAGAYVITLRDTALNSNATKDFTLNANYAVTPVVPSSPELLQEGNSVVLNITVTGGQPNTPYTANITVTLPAPLSTNYSRLVTLPTSSQKGTSITQVTFPDSTFEPSGSLTSYAGSYKAYFNLSQPLASSQFTIGFTDSSQYHRGQTVKVSAIGYRSNETATVTIRNQDSGATVYNVDVTPTSGGVVVANWTVPSNAAIGDYEVNITARTTVKQVPDSQVISIPGYTISVTVLDLSNRTVPSIVFEALDAATNKTYEGTSGAEGNATVNLENGKHTLTAFWNGLQVGETSITVAGAGNFTITCQLGDLKITVKDRNGLLIPSVDLDISYSYSTTRNSQSRNGSATGQTDVSGTYSLNSTPPGITYTFEASVYGVTFNGGNDTVTDLPVKAVSEVTIICPARTLNFNVVDNFGNPIPNARFSMLEVTAGIFYSATTDSSGSVTVDATFGRYKARVYAGTVLLNETVVDAFTDKQIEIQCATFNLQVNVKVVDFFGQPIPNANVMLVAADGTAQSKQAQSDGTAVFNGVIGGNVQITAYLSEGDDYYEAANVNVASPTTVQIQMGRYVVLGGLMVQTSFFITFFTILPTLLFFLIWELYMRRKKRPRKAVAKVEKAVSK